MDERFGFVGGKYSGLGERCRFLFDWKNIKYNSCYTNIKTLTVGEVIRLYRKNVSGTREKSKTTHHKLITIDSATLSFLFTSTNLYNFFKSENFRKYRHIVTRYVGENKEL